MTDPIKNPDDEFAAAFAELQEPAASSTPTAAAAPSAPAEAAVSPSASAPASAEAPAAAAAVPPGEAGNGSGASDAATPAASAEAPTSTAAQPAATPASEPAAAAPDYAAQIAALQAELAEVRKAQPAPAATPTEQPKPVYNTDEQAVVDSYIKEWPDVAKGEALLRRAEYGHLVNHIFEQLRPRLEALEAVSSTTSTRTQYQDLVSLVPDYDQVRDATLAWIETQPEYLKNAYQQVANQGSAKDVADLITRFKKETNYAAPAAAPAPTPAPAAAAAPAATPAPAGGLASPAAAAAVASLKPVRTTRSDPVSQPDPNDFDAAFKEFASA